MSELNRREALGAMAATAVTAGMNPAARPAERRPDLVKSENDREGTDDWQLTYVKFDGKAKFRQSLIEGYCTRMSAKNAINAATLATPIATFRVRFGYMPRISTSSIAIMGAAINAAM